MAPKPHILLVDDNPLDVELTHHALREAGMGDTVTTLNGGQDAIDYLLGEGVFQDRARYPLPQMVLLDLKMPGVDGFAVLDRVKRHHPIRRLPIVILTTSADDVDRARTYDMGANSYLVKPASYAALVDILRVAGKYWLSLNAYPPLG